MKKRLALLALALVMMIPYANTAKAGSDSSQPKREMRAAWIASVENIDMPSGKDKEEFKAWAEDTMSEIEDQNFNTAIFQVKPAGDALYPSDIEPWSSYITGETQGTNPGYDPLQIMLDAAHQRGIELHAWVNPYRLTMPGDGLSDLSDKNVAVQHPDWVVNYGDQYYLDPGIPETQEYVIKTIKELVNNYNIDAVHMDDYFYPYKIAGEDFPDSDSFDQFGENYEDKEDWRRNNVNTLVDDINTAIKSIDPSVEYGISPFGVWRNDSTDPSGSDTTAAQTNYDDLYADTRQWMKNGSIDYITPQIYWSRDFEPANYTILQNWWENEVDEYSQVHPTNLYIGLADYKVGTDTIDDTWNNPAELTEQIEDNRDDSRVEGQMHFSWSKILQNNLGYMDLVQDDVYQTKSLVPGTPWNGKQEPKKPNKVNIENDNRIYIYDHKKAEAEKFVVYRFEGNKEGDYTNPENIAGVVYRESQETLFIDEEAEKDQDFTYGVKSLSSTNIESKDAKKVKTKNHNS